MAMSSKQTPGRPDKPAADSPPDSEPATTPDVSGATKVQPASQGDENDQPPAVNGPYDDDAPGTNPQVPGGTGPDNPQNQQTQPAQHSEPGEIGVPAHPAPEPAAE